MKKNALLNFLFFALVLTLSLSVRAQDEPPRDEVQPPQKRPNVIRELGLSREQIQTIRRLNAERKTEREEAQRRLQEARRSLDAAIYADQVNDAEVRSRLKEFQTAQAEIAGIRANTEYEIRKILTPEQVVRFRELRQNFAGVREDFQNRPKMQRENFRRNQREKIINRQNQKPPQN